ncbi:MAG: hypothetical protein FWH32_01445 [Clostridiales bacterium]|nr:hypothetical protein [Clostridiales bacterium]
MSDKELKEIMDRVGIVPDEGAKERARARMLASIACEGGQAQGSDESQRVVKQSVSSGSSKEGFKMKDSNAKGKTSRKKWASGVVVAVAAVAIVCIIIVQPMIDGPGFGGGSGGMDGAQLLGTAFEGPTGSFIVDITGEDTEGIKSQIESVLADNDEVSVSGSKGGVTGSLAIEIPEGKTVRWGAEYSGSPSGAGQGLITLSGGGKFVVNGGKVQLTGGGLAVVAEGSVVVNGGTVFGYGSNVSGSKNDVVSAGALDVKGDGALIAWDSGAGHTEYTSGTTEDLKAWPEGSEVWGNSGSDSGVVYSSGANAGFIKLAVEVTGPQPGSFMVTVNSGTGSGEYAEGAEVRIVAAEAPEGQHFVGWETNPEVSFTGGTSASSAEATFTMPAANVEATAVYESEVTPTVTGVTVEPASVTIGAGGEHQFSATVEGTNNPPQTVTWTVAGGGGGTSISTTGLLTVAASETDGTRLTVTAESTYDTSVSGTAIATVSVAPPPAPTVTSVTVTPATAKVNSGSTKNFSASVKGTNHPSQKVTWTVTGGGAGTSISSSGVLTVAKAEKEGVKLTVRATSTVDTTKRGTAEVTVTHIKATVSSVTVSPHTVTINAGDDQKFTDVVKGANNPSQDVKWTVNGGVSGTKIDEHGNLHIADNETATKLEVKGTSVIDSKKHDTAIVTVVHPTAKEYVLTVEHGTGGGKHKAGEAVTIKADKAPDSEHKFDKWRLVSGGGRLADADDESTVFVMPEHDATITAVYVDITAPVTPDSPATPVAPIVPEDNGGGGGFPLWIILVAAVVVVAVILVRKFSAESGTDS